MKRMTSVHNCPIADVQAMMIMVSDKSKVSPDSTEGLLSLTYIKKKEYNNLCICPDICMPFLKLVNGSLLVSCRSQAAA